MNISNSIFEWSENEIMLKNGSKLRKKKHTVQSSVVYDNQKILEPSEKLKGDGNGSFFDRSSLQTFNEVPESNLGNAQLEIGLDY